MRPHGAAAVKPTTARREQTRQRLLDAAMLVYAREGFGRASVERICEQAGFSRGAFYSNFASVDELFLAGWQRRVDALLAAMAAGLAHSAVQPVRSLEEGVDRLLALVDVGAEWFQVQAEFTAHALRTPPLRVAVAVREERIVDLLAAFLDQALAQVSRRAHDVRTLAQHLVAVHDGTLQQCLFDADPAAANARRRDLFLLVIRAGTQEDPDDQL